MHIPREELMSRLSATEFLDWMAFDRIEPIGQRREEIHTAFLLACIFNWFCRGENKEAKSIEDFMLFMEKEKKPEPERQDIAPFLKLLVDAQKEAKQRG